MVVDEVTVKVLSSACSVSDLMEEGISVIEDVHKKRQPFPHMPALYFVRPANDVLRIVASDFEGKALYSSAHVFLSSMAAREHVSIIKQAHGIVNRLGTFKEALIEYLVHDDRTFTTYHDADIQNIYGDNADKAGVDLNSMAIRTSTLFATLRERPVIRYSAHQGQDESATSGQGTGTVGHGDSLSSPAAQFAHMLLDRVDQVSSRVSDFPSGDTCDVLVLDR